MGANLRAARQGAGLTMSELATKAGVTQPYISQVERGLVTPSIASLYSLAQALGVPPTTLLPSAAEDPSVTRAGRGIRIVQSHRPTAPLGFLLSGRGHLEVCEYTLEPGVRDDTTFSHPGEEFLYVLEGSLGVALVGEKSYVLRVGDAVHFDATKPHRVRAAGRVTCRFLLVASHPYHLPQS